MISRRMMLSTSPRKFNSANTEFVGFVACGALESFARMRVVQTGPECQFNMAQIYFALPYRTPPLALFSPFPYSRGGVLFFSSFLSLPLNAINIRGWSSTPDLWPRESWSGWKWQWAGYHWHGTVRPVPVV